MGEEGYYLHKNLSFVVFSSGKNKPPESARARAEHRLERDSLGSIPAPRDAKRNKLKARPSILKKEILLASLRPGRRN